ncbi:helix-turn-helix domain-containing protein [Gemmata sp. JC717]|uniref:DnaA/Hda family protein n=1 Tax=Gemmata algarum TaxID=2975278 RepID=UPI0021BAA7BD|nr:helix-turn-helix domain-containing protein [Gemmata algarum]MDY3555783.1 helix-turn-helix domain-containing protein [Gemmata algarum]
MGTPTARWNGFLVLPENRVAVRALRSVCRSVLTRRRPGANPVVLHGPPGTGKSRLSASLVQQLANTSDGVSAQVVSAGDVARAADEGLDDDAFVSCDLLALEDVQHLSARAAEDATELLDRRTARRRATVVTASAGPAQLAHLPQRLTSRLSSGLVVRLEPLGAPSRLAILTEAARQRQVRLTPDALEWLASQTTGGGVRTTLGLLQNLAQVAAAFPGPLTRADAQQALADSGQPTSAPPDISGIVERTAAAFGVTVKELLGASRLRGVMRPRQIAMYLARELTGLSLPRLGAAFGRDHTTVLHACRKVEAEVAADLSLAKQVNDLRTALG